MESITQVFQTDKKIGFQTKHFDKAPKAFINFPIALKLSLPSHFNEYYILPNKFDSKL